jgi:hypothetical protein
MVPRFGIGLAIVGTRQHIPLPTAQKQRSRRSRELRPTTIQNANKLSAPRPHPHGTAWDIVRPSPPAQAMYQSFGERQPSVEFPWWPRPEECNESSDILASPSHAGQRGAFDPGAVNELSAAEGGRRVGELIEEGRLDNSTSTVQLQANGPDRNVGETQIRVLYCTCSNRRSAAPGTKEKRAPVDLGISTSIRTYTYPYCTPCSQLAGNNYSIHSV